MKSALKWPLLLFAGFVVLVGLLILGATLFAHRVPARSVLHVELDGPLHDTPASDLAELFSGEESLSLRGLVRVVGAAATDENIVGIVLDIQEPELGMAQIEELAAAMETFRSSGKWSVAYLETAGEFARGNGTYALATLADGITLAPSGDVGLVGLSAEIPFLKKTFAKLDIGVHVEQRYAYKNAGNMFNQDHFTAEHREAVTTLVDDLQSELVSLIAARRHTDAAKVSEWMATGPHAAQSALDTGMVDSLGYWDSISTEVEKRSGRDDSLLAASDYADSLPDGSGPKIALIIGEGEIHRGESTGGFDDPTIGSATISKAFREARDAKVEGILLRVDSPGGSYIASDIVRREVELSRDAGIPVVVSMGNVAASGGYFIAMQADRIIAEPGTITGSIGVLAGRFATRQFLDKWLGVTFDSYETTPAAGFFSSLDLPTEAQKQRLGESLDRIYADFVTKAAKGRNKTYDEIHAVAQGRVWSGRAALARGLVDELGGMKLAMTRLKEVAEIAADASVSVEVYPEPKSGLEVIIDALQSRSGIPADLREVAAAVTHATGVRGDDRGVLRLPYVPRL